MTTYLIPLEPIDSRYTAQWYEWFPQEVRKLRDDVEVIDGEQFDHNLEGEFFLDPIGTNYYKSSQIQNLMSKADEFEDGDEIFLFDVWFPGLEAIAYVRDMLDIDLKIRGILHAGTYDAWDLTNQKGMESWGRELENAWFEILDEVIVGTEFHRRFVTERRELARSKVSVTGLPIDIERLRDMRTHTYENRIVFTGRLSEEKGIETVREMQDAGYPIHVTMEHNHSKEEYYELLANSRAVFAPSLQETFGYGVLEGLALDCQPVVPDRLAFQSTVPEQFRYNGLSELKAHLDTVLEGFVPPSQSVDRYEEIVQSYHYEDVIQRMFE